MSDQGVVRWHHSMEKTRGRGEHQAKCQVPCFQMFCTLAPTDHHSWKGPSWIVSYKILCLWSSCLEHIYFLDKGWLEDAGTIKRRRCWHESGPEAAFRSFSCLSAESESVVNLFSKHRMLSLPFDFPFVFCCNFSPSSHHQVFCSVEWCQTASVIILYILACRVL